MTNLEYLDKFLTETYGAICFHNDKEDGFVNFEKDSKKQMETLAIYFPCELDLQSEEISNRLTKVAGKDFYKRYIGNEGLKISPIYGNTIVTAFYFDNKIVDIDYNKSFFASYPTINCIIDYFIGKNIDKFTLGSPYFGEIEELKTNNGFIVHKDENIKQVLEKFLIKNNLPIITKENGFYIAPLKEIAIGDKKVVYNEKNF